MPSMFGGNTLSYNDTFFLHFFSFFCFCNATFIHSGYVVRPPQQALLFTVLHLLQGTLPICVVLPQASLQKSLDSHKTFTRF